MLNEWTDYAQSIYDDYEMDYARALEVNLHDPRAAEKAAAHLTDWLTNTARIRSL